MSLVYRVYEKSVLSLFILKFVFIAFQFRYVKFYLRESNINTIIKIKNFLKDYMLFNIAKREYKT